MYQKNVVFEKKNIVDIGAELGEKQCSIISLEMYWGKYKVWTLPEAERQRLSMEIIDRLLGKDVIL